MIGSLILKHSVFGTPPSPLPPPISPKRAQDALRSLLMEPSRGGGVHLVVICMRGLPRVTKGMKQTYDTIVRIRDKVTPDVPLVTVITELENRSASPDDIPSMDEWWQVTPRRCPTSTWHSLIMLASRLYPTTAIPSYLAVTSCVRD
ncbi:hypothetical protein J3R82DRAFT_6584 [Butyriboletus roseoflavus]|nr:hypothetical protein J3R82DRAFT_6584 [Butyriboletus roseoflavus]